MTFEHAPPVRVYFDGGLAYFGERDGDVPLGRHLVEAGVVTTADLERARSASAGSSIWAGCSIVRSTSTEIR